MRASDAPGNISDFVQHFFRNRAVAIQIWSHDLDVDGRGQAEVQNLRNDIDGEYVERDARIIMCQHASEFFNILVRWPVFFRELDLDVGIGGADRRGGRVGKIQARVGQADVIDDGDDLIGGNVLADGAVDVIAKRGSLFDARTGAGPDVDLELPGIYGGEEVLPQPRRQQRHRADGKDDEDDEEGSGEVDTERQKPHVAIAEGGKDALESALKADKRIPTGLLARYFCIIVLVEQVLGHRRHKRSREQVTGEHGEDHGLRHGDEEIARHAAEQEHGHEHNADREGRNEGRNGNLRGAVENGLLQSPCLVRDCD